MSRFTDTYSNRTYGLDKLFERVKEPLNEELKANGYQPIGLRTFKRVVKYYFKCLFYRVIYKHESVEVYDKFGNVTGNKILCTEFNPKNIDVNKTDGYYYYMMLRTPLKYRHLSFRPNSVWKKKQYQNVVLNGKDYPETNETTYGIY